MSASPEVLYASLLRPFPTRALAKALRPVEANAVSLERLLTTVLISPPGTPEDWRFELDQILARLWQLREACEAANGTVIELSRSADRDFDVAVRAMRLMLSGLAVSGEGASLAPLEPESGHGDEPAPTPLRTPGNDPGAA
jgi:hypothetical protein